MFKHYVIKLAAATLFIAALLFTGCAGKQKLGDVVTGLEEQPEQMEIVDLSEGQEGFGRTATLTPEEQRRIEEEELARREQMERMEAMKLAEKALMQDIFFDFDRSDLTDAAREILAAIAEWMEKDRAVNLRLEGHADERGTSEYNLALGDRRANAARAYLANLGINNGRLTTISYGEEMPLMEGSNEEAWAKNRRVHFEIR